MSPWTSLLESLHSALIDELTERHPEPKPTLGMPVRQTRLATPSSASRLLICEVSFEKARGFVMLGFEPAFMRALKVTPEEFWQAILKRAGTEFMRREIRPKTGNAVEIDADPKKPLPAGYAEPQRIIWIPFEIPAGVCYLGMGV